MSTYPTRQPPARNGLTDPRSSGAPQTPDRKTSLNDRRSTRRRA